MFQSPENSQDDPKTSGEYFNSTRIIIQDDGDGWTCFSSSVSAFMPLCFAVLCNKER